MTMFNYESEELYQMARGETIPSTPVYMADCKKEIFTEVTPNYPKLIDYEKEWMYFAKNIYNGGTPVPLEYLEVQTYGQATVENVIPFAYKSASFKGSTKYRDIDTGDILDKFDKTKNLELVSVEMPVLKTVGKNLLSYTNSNTTVNMNQNPTDIIYEDGGFNFNGSNNNWYSVWYDLNLKPNTTYTISYHSNFIDCSIFKSTVNTYVSSEVVAQVGIKNKNESQVQFATLTFTSPSEGFVRIRLTNSQMSGYNVVTNLQLEENSQATSYEPHQSNILTVNEPVELRGVGAVKDELNLLTGELTQRVGEIVLTGSDDEDWKFSTENINFKSFQLKLNGKQNSKNFVCDKLPNKSSWSEFVDGIWADNSIILTLNKNTVNSINGLKNWLSQNPLTLHYELAKQSVKTVDLNGLIKPYEGTNHYTVSSNALPPLLLLLVPIESTGNQTLNDINTEE